MYVPILVKSRNKGSTEQVRGPQIRLKPKTAIAQLAARWPLRAAASDTNAGYVKAATPGCR